MALNICAARRCESNGHSVHDHLASHNTRGFVLPQETLHFQRARMAEKQFDITWPKLWPVACSFQDSTRQMYKSFGFETLMCQQPAGTQLVHKGDSRAR